MADINEKISGTRQSTKVSSTGDASFGKKELELAQVLNEQRIKWDKDARKRAMDTAKAQAKELLKYERAGLVVTQKERIKFLQDQNKKDQTQKMKDMMEYHKRSAEIAREYNKTILESGSGATLKQRVTALADETTREVTDINKMFDNLSKLVNDVMASYAKYQIGINTRLQGTEKTFSGMSSMLKDTIGVTPFIKTQAMFENLNKLTELGIVYNLEQRAFLETIADNISTTFDATNGTLLRLVRLQQSDSTAARLGLETALTQYLNRMFEDSSYLNNNFDTVSGALIEATSQMTNSATIQFEYIVQKWLGSLSAVGLSDTTISNLAQAIGYLGSGNIAGLESLSGMRNLLIMASARAGNLNYAEMLTEGLDSSETNQLLKSVVEYIQEIASNNNKVVQAQYASLFGITLADMTAAKNLRTSLDDIASSTLDYAGAINELGSSMRTMASRMSIASMLDTMYSNLQYGLATNIADSPVLYSLWKITDLIQGITGGINIPFISAVGTGVDVNTTVDNLLKLTVVGASTLGMIGDLVSGIGNTLDPAKMLSKMQIGFEAGTTTRGSGLDFTRASRGAQRAVSRSTYVGTTSGSDIQASTLAQSEKDMQKKLEQKQQETVDYSKVTADYLTSTFNPKMDAVLVMMAKMASYNLTMGAGEAFSEKDLSTLMLGKTTGIVVSEAKEAEERVKAITNIDENVKDILDVLRGGIAVSINSPVGTAQTPTGFSQTTT